MNKKLSALESLEALTKQAHTTAATPSPALTCTVCDAALHLTPLERNCPHCGFHYPEGYETFSGEAAMRLQLLQMQAKQHWKEQHYQAELDQLKQKLAEAERYKIQNRTISNIEEFKQAIEEGVSHLFLKSGEYLITDPIRIQHPISLTGVGERPHLVALCEGNALHFSAKGQFHAVNIGFSHRSSQGHANLLVIQQGEVDIQECLFSETEGDAPTHGVALKIENAVQGILKNNVFKNNGVQLYLGGRSQLHCQYNEFKAAKRHHLICAEETTSIIQNNQFEGAGQHGVLMIQSAKPHLFENLFQSNQIAGIELTDEVQPCIEKNTFIENQIGVSFLKQAQGVFRENQCIRNQLVGIQLAGGSAPTIENNPIQANGAEGIRCFEHAHPTLQHNLIVENGASGIHIQGVSRPSLLDNTIGHNQGYGIAILEQAIPLIQKNFIHHNQKAGIIYTIQADEEALCFENEIALNQEEGIVIQSGQLILESNTLQLNQKEGIRIEGASVVDLKKTRLAHNEGTGLQLQQRSQTTMDDCIFESNQNGILVEQEASLKLQNTLIQYHQEAGLKAQEQAKVELDGCTLRAQKTHGLVFSDQAYFMLNQLKSTLNQGCGLVVEGNATGVVQHSFFELNYHPLDIQTHCAVELNEIQEKFFLKKPTPLQPSITPPQETLTPPSTEPPVEKTRPPEKSPPHAPKVIQAKEHFKREGKGEEKQI